MMRPLLMNTVASLSLLLSFSLHAQDDVLSKNFSVCMDKSEGVTINMLNCMADETTYQDIRLNKAYKSLMAELSPERKKQLQEAQRAWIKYRDANCQFYADPEGGTMATVLSNDCFMQSTANRAKELELLKQ
jgi:uncharacterized protein YecT (DUF1311 family)